MIKNLLIAILLSVSFVGVASADPNVERDARNAPDRVVCDFATVFPPRMWIKDGLSRWYPYVQEAARRGLDCGVSYENPLAKAAKAAKAAERLAGLEPTDLCNKSVIRPQASGMFVMSGSPTPMRLSVEA